MGRRRKQQQENMFLPAARGGGHRFYEALNALLAEAGFDRFVEELCAPHYGADDKPGRPSLAPAVFFRMLLVGYFEGIGSERGIAWRCADSMSLRDFLGLATHVACPDQSTVSRTRRRLPPEVFDAVFAKVLGIVEAKGLLKGRVRGVDSTYLRADASMKSIVRKDTGEGYRAYIKRVTAEDNTAQEEAAKQGGDDDSDSGSGGDAPSTAEASAAKPVTAEEAVRHDRRRKKTTSNDDWHSLSDPDARITRMKNGTTRLAYKAEHVVDMETGVILAAELLLGNEHDAATLERSLAAAEKNVTAVRGDQPSGTDGEAWHKQPIAEVVADKGYHKTSVLLALAKTGYRTYIPEKKQRGRRKFVDKGGNEAAKAFHANSARTARAKGKAHQRRRGEMLERPNQHLYDRGGLRNLTLTEQVEVRKRVIMQSAAFNLGAVLRKALGAGAPRWLAVLATLFIALRARLRRRQMSWSCAVFC
jgi:transposase